MILRRFFSSASSSSKEVHPWTRLLRKGYGLKNDDIIAKVLKPYGDCGIDQALRYVIKDHGCQVTKEDVENMTLPVDKAKEISSNLRIARKNTELSRPIEFDFIDVKGSKIQRAVLSENWVKSLEEDEQNWFVYKVDWKETLEKEYDLKRVVYHKDKKSERQKKAATRKRYGLENRGGGLDPEDTAEKFGDCGAVWANRNDKLEEGRDEALAEDLKLAGVYEDAFRRYRSNPYTASLFESAEEQSPADAGGVHRNENSALSSRFADVWGRALQDDALEAQRPVLNLELSDYETPYMMKREAMKRLLLSHCRNPLDFRLVETFLNKRPDLIKARAEARAPPEVFEPLMAFRGDRTWRYDARELGVGKLEGINEVLDRVVNEKPVDERQDDVWETAVPSRHETLGGTRFGRPLSKMEQRLRKWRYPTLQPAFHSLPEDPTWRSHVAQTVAVLERNKGWDYKSKLRTVNTMKEVYDNMAPSEWYRTRLDERLPYNRPGKKAKGHDVVYEQPFPKKWRIHMMRRRSKRAPWRNSSIRRAL